MSISRQFVTVVAVTVAALVAVGVAAAQDGAQPIAVERLASFEEPGAFETWTLRGIEAEIAGEHATHGRHAARVVFPAYEAGGERWPALYINAPEGDFSLTDWSRYSVLRFDAFVASAEEAPVKLRIDDASGTRWTMAEALPPGESVTYEAPIAAMAGALDLSQITHVDIYMGEPTATHEVFIDNLRVEALPVRLEGSTVLPDPFGAGHVTVQAQLTRPEPWQLQVISPDGDVVGRASGEGRQLEYAWDGSGFGDRPVGPGEYRVVARVEDTSWPEAGVHVQQLAQVEVEPIADAPRALLWEEPTTRKVMHFTRPDDDATLYRCPGMSVRSGEGEPLSVDMARNEWEGTQLVILPRERMALRVRIEDLAHTQTGAAFDLDESTIYQVGYVETEDPERYDVEYIGWWPDPLLDQRQQPGEQLIAEPHECMPVWLSLRSAKDTAPGLYQGEVALYEDGERLGAVPLQVRVHDVTLPDSTTLPTAFSTYDSQIARVYGMEQLEGEMRMKYYQFVADHRINPDNIYRGSPPDIDVLRHFDEQDQLNAFNIVQTGRGTLEDYTDERVEQMRSMLVEYVARLEEAGLDDEAYIYGFDEVSDEYYPAMMKVGRMLDEAVPEIPFMTTARDNSYGIDSGLDEVVDIWVPLTARYDLEAADAARERGREVWWYICIGPRHPYANWFVEYPAIEARLLWWMTYQHRAEGFLYYAISRWPNQDEPIVMDGTNRTNWVPASWRTANGDGSLFCAGPDGPVTTVRFENIRDGLEDHELLTMLEAQRGDDGALGREMCDAMIPSLTDFTHDPDKLAAMRVRLLEALAGD